MKPESPEDRLLDELLREQAHGTDVAFLRRIEAAVDARHLPVVAQRPATGSHRWLAIAAGIALAAGVGMWWQSDDQPAAPKMTGAEPQPANPPMVKKERPKAVAESPRKNRLAPPSPLDATKMGIPDERMAANRILPEPNPFREMSKLPSLSTNYPAGGALAGSGHGKLLEKLPGQAEDDRAEFAELVRNPTGDGTHSLPAMVIPKGVPKGSNIKGHYGKPPLKGEMPAPESAGKRSPNQ